jgi:long-chain acyl-CoA synthetase
VAELRQRLSQLLDAAPADAPAVTYDHQTWTWGDLRRVRDDLVAELDRTGVGEAGRVGLILENRPAHVAALLAIISSGRCVTTLSPLQPADRLAGDIERTGLSVVLGSAAMTEPAHVRAAIESSGRLITLTADGALAALGTDASLTAASLSEPGVAIEMLTSGTTGPPKRIQLTHGQLDVALHSAHIRARSANGKPVLGSGTVLVAVPLVHIGGLWGALSAAFAGRHIALLERFRLEPWVEAVATFKPRAAGLVPAALRTVLDANVEPSQLASLQVVTCGTAVGRRAGRAVPEPIDALRATGGDQGGRGAAPDAVDEGQPGRAARTV